MSKSTARQVWLDFPKPLKIFLSAAILLSAASWIFSVLGKLLHLHPPNFWNYSMRHLGGDFADFQQVFTHLHSLEFFRATSPTGLAYAYPAPLAIFYQLLFVLWHGRAHSFLILWTFIVLSVLAATLVLYSAMRRRNVARFPAATFCILTVILSYPLQFEFLRGNVEVFIWVTLIAAIWAYRTDKLWMAGALLGVAIACKWYPVILLGFCLRRTKYKVIPIALVTCALVAILSDLWLGPTFKIAATETRHGTQMFIDLYAKRYVGPEVDHSFFSAYKALAHPFQPNLGVALRWYLALAAGGAVVLYWVRIRKLPVVNQIVILFVLSISLSPVSFDYTLLHLYTCWAVFTLYVLDRYMAGEEVPMANWAMFWFAFAMASHNYAILFGTLYGAQFRCVGLVALLYVFLRHPFFESKEARRTSLSSGQIV